MAAKKSRKKNTKAVHKNDAMKGHVKAVIFIAAALFLLVFIMFTEQTGFLGAAMSLAFRTILGVAALPFPFFLLIVSIGYFWSDHIENPRNRFAGLFIVFAVLLLSFHLKVFLQQPDPSGANLFRTMFEIGLRQEGGGVIGAAITSVLFFLVKDLGCYIIIVSMSIIALLLLTNRSISELLSIVGKVCRFLLRVCRAFIRIFYRPEKNMGKAAPAPALRTALESSPAVQHDMGSEKSYTVKGYIDTPIFPQEKDEGEEAAGSLIVTPEEEEAPEEGGEDVSASAPAFSSGRLTESPADVTGHGEESYEEYAEYKIPPLDLLAKINRSRDYQQQELIHERAQALEKTFESFGVKVIIKEVQAGPAVTRYEIQPETGVKVSKILSLSDDLALNLAAEHVRIEAPIPGKAAIGIEIPNKVISPVYLREVLEDEAFPASASPLLTGLGKDIAGMPVFADLIKMPHLLVAGTTGSGKSVCINSILCSILFKASPRDVKFLLVDPKMVELSVYNGIPHLIAPVVTEAKKASLALRSMVKEMVRRYELFAQSGVRDIAKYNEESGFLPYIVVVIDELADLMMVAPSEVEDSIVRLSQMARAAGIHLVIATQRPSVDVITGLIKANIISRIAFTVSSQIDSRTILDTGGAEKLLGRGDMLYHPMGSHKLMRVQGAFIGENEIMSIINYIKGQGNLPSRDVFLSEETEEERPDEDTDILLPDAINLVLETGHASISLIQRRFRVGYNRAARIVDEMERFGVVGRSEGSKPRQILIRSDQVKGILERIQGISNEKPYKGN